jgi:hypothetical protein
MNRTNPRKFPLACATLTLLALGGCGGEVLITEASGASAGAGTGSTGQVGGSSSSSGGAGGGGGECVPDPAAGLAEVTLHNPTSGAFIGDILHLSVSVGDAPEHYTLLKLVDGVGYVVSQKTELDGPANLAAIDATSSARVHGGSAGLSADVIDVSDPEHPFKKSSVVLNGTVPAGFWKVFSVVDRHLFTCLSTLPDTDAVLFDVPLDEATPPVAAAVEQSWEHVCSGFSAAHDSGIAHGRVWLTWGYESDLQIFDVGLTGVHKQGDYNYNPDGVHQYGPVLTAATDGERIVLDPANDSEVFLYTPGSPQDYITHAYFGLSGPKQLLAVVGKVSYWATAKGVRAYDVTDIDAPVLLDFHADADFGEGLAALIAQDPTHLAVVDADGRLYVIPLGSSGPVAPLKTYLGEPGSGSAAPCGSK